LPDDPRTEDETDDQSSENGIGSTEGQISEDIKARDDRVQGIQEMIEHKSSFPAVPKPAMLFSHREL
jgi:hypothetical protein